MYRSRAARTRRGLYAGDGVRRRRAAGGRRKGWRAARRCARPARRLNIRTQRVAGKRSFGMRAGDDRQNVTHRARIATAAARHCSCNVYRVYACAHMHCVRGLCSCGAHSKFLTRGFKRALGPLGPSHTPASFQGHHSDRFGSLLVRSLISRLATCLRKKQDD